MIISVFFKKQGWANRLISLVGRIKEDKGRSRNRMILRSLWLLLSTRSLGPYRPLLLAPAEGIWGPFGPSLGALWAPSSSHISKMVLKSFLQRQMAKKIVSEVMAIKSAKIVKTHFF